MGVVGATGQVGAVIRRLLEQQAFPVAEIRFFASAHSAGSTLPWRDLEVIVEDAATADPAGLDVALLSAGATTSRALAQRFADAGAVVTDNSSAFRTPPSSTDEQGACKQRPRVHLTYRKFPAAQRFPPVLAPARTDNLSNHCDPRALSNGEVHLTQERRLAGRLRSAMSCSLLVAGVCENHQHVEATSHKSGATTLKCEDPLYHCNRLAKGDRAMTTMLRHEHQIDGLIVIEEDAGTASLRCRWPLDIDEWFVLNDEYDTQAYLAGLSEFKRSGKAVVTGIFGDLRLGRKNDSELRLELWKTNNVSQRVSLLIDIPLHEVLLD